MVVTFALLPPHDRPFRTGFTEAADVLGTPYALSRTRDHGIFQGIGDLRNLGLNPFDDTRDVQAWLRRTLR